MSNVVKITDIPGGLRTFDILNCQPDSIWFKYIQHTAMIYQPNLDRTMVAESTYKGIDGKNGVQLTSLKRWLDYYPGKVYVRQLNINAGVGVEANADVAKYLADTRKHIVHDVVKGYLGTPYPNMFSRAGRWYLIKAVLDCWHKHHENIPTERWIYCTDLVARIYRDCGLCYDINTAEMEPDDTRQDGKMERYLKPYVYWDREYRIK